MDKKIIEFKQEILRLNKIVVEQAGEIEKLKSFTDRDFLTGLYNRQGFVREAEKFLGLIREGEKYFKKSKERRKFAITDFSLIFIDLDKLKKINDRYGHKFGDKYIKLCADIFTKNLREIDIVGRWGGDEFVIGLIDVNSDGAEKVMEKLKGALSRARVKGAPSFKPSASFGMVSAGAGKKANISALFKLIEKADLAMYEAKMKNGRNSVVVIK